MSDLNFFICAVGALVAFALGLHIGGFLIYLDMKEQINELHKLIVKEDPEGHKNGEPK